MRFSAYDTAGFYDELFDSNGSPRSQAQLLINTIESLSDGQLLRYQHSADRLLLQMGITFNVYGEQAGVEKIFPFDILPRIVSATEWSRIERGLKQRIRALLPLALYRPYGCYIGSWGMQERLGNRPGVKEGVRNSSRSRWARSS